MARSTLVESFRDIETDDGNSIVDSQFVDHLSYNNHAVAGSRTECVCANLNFAVL